ncbi:hypothetical protein [Streptomyces sp. NPDC056160]|uniref:hypothetical protein n=1 Tax=Streptomyces sp. NPDC056160 TaxID=3345731 RepID=UPI0035E15E24
MAQDTVVGVAPGVIGLMVGPVAAPTTAVRPGGEDQALEFVRLQRLDLPLHVSSGLSAAEVLGPFPEPVLEDEAVAAADGLEQLGAHGRFGGEAGRAAQDGEGGADAGGDVRLEECVGVEGGAVEALGGLAAG